MATVHVYSDTGASKPVVHSSTVQAGPNIAVAKYWGKRDGMTCMFSCLQHQALRLCEYDQPYYLQLDL